MKIFGRKFFVAGRVGHVIWGLFRKIFDFDQNFRTCRMQARADSSGARKREVLGSILGVATFCFWLKKLKIDPKTVELGGIEWGKSTVYAMENPYMQ